MTTEDIPSDIEQRLRQQDGQRVKAARIRLGWSKEEAARFAGISSITWKRIEDGLPVRDGNFGAALGAVGLGSVRPESPDDEPVPGDQSEESGPADVVAAIMADPELIPEAKAHLVNQYDLLLRVREMSTLNVRKRPEEEPGLRAVARTRRGTSGEGDRRT